ncbi:energy-coupling factor ABC transporter ATP-binding protein [Microbacterium esteraromaticum]|uniref:energy-coupling factor ABC transporter ATP-binding protein n=1 Tax=Microbacterium esteraromaticum TaxID=57043 RepID=UPI002175141D|nr:ABC transporter ATP-binding protein [Microbacterium esteraromaticum]
MTDPGIRFEGAGCTIDGERILHDVDLSLSAPRTAVIGANGSGKSTFARMLNGLRPCTQGRASVLGHDIVRDARMLRDRVGFVFTNPEAQILMPTPAEDIALSLRDLPKPLRAERVLDTLSRFGLAGREDQPAAALSGGQRQLLAIASVLASEPDLLVADEPTTLLDLRNARSIGELLLGLEVPVVIVTHDLELAAACDEAVLFDEGRVHAVGAPVDVIAAYRRLIG